MYKPFMFKYNYFPYWYFNFYNLYYFFKYVNILFIKYVLRASYIYILLISFFTNVTRIMDFTKRGEIKLFVEKIILAVSNAYYSCSSPKLLLCLLLREIYTHSTKRSSILKMLHGHKFYWLTIWQNGQVQFLMINWYWRLCYAFIYLQSIA